MKVNRLLGLRGNAYSASRYLYGGIKTNSDGGAVLLLPDTFYGDGYTTGCFKNIYYYKGQKFSEKSVYILQDTFEGATKTFVELNTPVAVIKDITNKEIYVVEREEDKAV